MIRRAFIVAALLVGAVVGTTHAAFLSVAGGRTGVAVPSGGGGGGDSPSWVTSIDAGKWAIISGGSPSSGFSATNTLSSVDPYNDAGANPNYPGTAPWVCNGSGGNTGVIDYWGGGASTTTYGTAGGYFLVNAGHSQYLGNEVYAFDVDTRTWARLTDPSTADISCGTFGTAAGVYSDSTPMLPHTYQNLIYDATNNAIISTKLEVGNEGGQTICRAAFFDLDDSTWRFTAQAGGTFSCREAGWSALRTTTNVIYGEGGDTGDAWSISITGTNGVGGSWTEYNQVLGDLYNVAGYDPLGDQFVVMRSNEVLYLFDPDNFDGTPTVATQSGSGPSSFDEAGIQWSDKRQAFLVTQDGSDSVFELKNTSGTTWTWTDITSGANAVTPAVASSSGMYSRFQVLSYDDGEEIALLVNSNTAGVYAFRVP